MLRLTLAQMRQAVPRLVAAGVAIVLGTSFVAATLLVSAFARDAAYDAANAWLGEADMIVWGSEEWLSAKADETIAEVPGVAITEPDLSVWADLSSDGRFEWVNITSSGSTITGYELQDGRNPHQADEIAVQASTAERLGVGIGDTVEVRSEAYQEGREAIEISADLTVVGLLESPGGLIAQSSVAVADEDQLLAWSHEISGESGYAYILVTLAEDVDSAVVADGIQDALPFQVTTETAESIAELQVQAFTGSTSLFTALVLGFAAIAMLIAGLVISNTFQVLVAQRARTLALLRCVGATRAQVRRAVLTESAVLGVAGSIVGLALGIGLAHTALRLVHIQVPGIPAPDALHVTPAVVLAPLLTGVAVTILAALAPARQATRVTPVAALRPATAPEERQSSRRRLLLCSALLAAGVLALGAALVLANTRDHVNLDSVLPQVALGVLGGGMSFVAVLLSTIFIAPAFIRATRHVASRLGGGPTITLATSNAIRNPRRTAATASALVIGVTLVTTMSTGAATLRASLDNLLDLTFPADAQVIATSTGDGPFSVLSDEQISVITSHPGVAAALPVVNAWVTVTTGADSDREEVWSLTAVSFDPGAAEDVLHDASVLDGLDDETVLLADWVREAGTGSQPYDVTLALDDPSTWNQSGSTATTITDEETDGVRLTARSAQLDLGAVVLTPAVMERLHPDAPVGGMYLRLDPEADAAEVLGDLQDALGGTADTSAGFDSAPWVAGSALERESFDQIITVVLLVGVGLLAVAIAIALIGVANTLSLSVIERRRESATLRAIGLTRGGLRGALALEGVLLAMVGVLVGIVLGIGYGWAGITVLLADPSGYAPIELAVPWLHLAGIVAIAALAGLLSSVIPARSALRTPPVEALKAE